MTATTAVTPTLQPRLLLGLQYQIKDCAHYISDEEVVYPVGGVLCIHNIHQKKQKFIKMPEKGVNITALAVSPNKRFVCVAEKTTLTVYDPWSCKRRKQILIPLDRDPPPNSIACLTFTSDSKNVIVVTGEPDWWMYVFKVERGKLDTQARATNSNGTGTIRQIAPNPNDPNLLVLVGCGLYRNLGCTENNWRQFGYMKGETLDISCATWISQDRLLAGTTDGRILFFESAELRNAYHAYDLSTITLKMSEEASQSQPNLLEEAAVPVAPSMSEHLDLPQEEQGEVEYIISFGKGILFAFQTGTIYFFEKESPNRYKRRSVFRIPDRSVVRSEEELTDEVESYVNVVFNSVKSIQINISEDRFLATCNETQIYSARLWGLDINITESVMSELGFPLHHGPIGAVAVCSWKPIFLSSGVYDRTLRIWNYESETMELYKKYTEDIYGCALHPNGLFAVVGFSDKLRFLKILIDEFLTTREYSIRACKLCRFSKLGHLFAAANGNIIQVYSSVSFEHLFNLKGHNGFVTGLSWVHDDYKVASCGTEGAVYEWQISTTRRICETIIKSCSFKAVAITTDGKSNFAVGSDGRVREIVNSNVYGDITITTTGGLDGVVLSNSDLMLFATGNNGMVYSIQCPFIDIPVFNEYVVHSEKCNTINISYDDKFLITSSNGCICVWKILNAEAKQIKLDKEFQESTQVLIERTNLVDKVSQIRDLQVRMNELQTEHAYQMRQSEALHASTVKEIHDNYCAAIEELKEKNELMEHEHNQEISNINVEINEMKAEHEVFVQNLEANYNEKLIMEYDKFMRLEEKMGQMRARYERELKDLTDAKRMSEETITNKYVQILQDKDVQIEELNERIVQSDKEAEETKRQIEDDADREIFELKHQFEKELREEQDLNVKLRGETQMSKKKLQSSLKEIDDLQHTVQQHEMEQYKLKTVIYGLEGATSDLRKEISERDSTIQDKERRISELKTRNQELEKFKFILEFKIDELKAQIEPRERKIREQMEQLNDMVSELENLQKIILSLELQLTELREKLKAAHNEVKRNITRNRVCKSSVKKMKTDIYNASGVVHEIPKLQKSIKDMYHKYNIDKDFEIQLLEDQEAKNEFLRQRDFLENTVKVLKGQVVKSQKQVGKNRQLIDQNAFLITETNKMRKNLKAERTTNKRLEAIMGFGKQHLTITETHKKIDTLLATKEDLRKEFADEIDEDERCIEVLKDENARLLEKITLKEDEQSAEELSK